jgi:hypothetical protein
MGSLRSKKYDKEFDMDMNKIRGIVAAVLGLAGFATVGMTVSSALAAPSVCHCNGVPCSTQCFHEDLEGDIHSAESKLEVYNGSKRLGVNLTLGVTAQAQGLTQSNQPISDCKVTDATDGGSSVYDTSGCSSAYAHKLTVR